MTLWDRWVLYLHGYCSKHLLKKDHFYAGIAFPFMGSKQVCEKCYAALTHKDYKKAEEAERHFKMRLRRIQNKESKNGTS